MTEQTWLPTYVRDAALAQLQIEFLNWSVGRPYSNWLWYEFLDATYEQFRLNPPKI